MRHIAFSFFLGATVLLMNAFPGMIQAEWEGRGYAPEGVFIGEPGTEIVGQSSVGLTGYDLRVGALDRYQASPVRYDGQYSAYGYNYPSYSTYPAYQTSYSTYPAYQPSYSTYPAYQTSYSTYPAYQTSYPGYRGYSGYGSYYYNPGMHNPNTTFVNPPSSLNRPYGYPSYSETYIRRY